MWQMLLLSPLRFSVGGYTFIAIQICLNMTYLQIGMSVMIRVDSTNVTFPLTSAKHKCSTWVYCSTCVQQKSEI